MHVGLYFWLLLNENFHGEEVVEFLEYLTGKVPGEWTVVWDRNNIHSKSKVVKAWLARHPKVVVEDFPAYDPRSTPTSGCGVGRSTANCATSVLPTWRNSSSRVGLP